MSKRVLRAAVSGALVIITSWSVVGIGPATADDPTGWDVVRVETEAPQRRSISPLTLDPSAYAELRLDQDAIQTLLATTPFERTDATGTEIAIPSPSGELRTFVVFRAETFEPALAAKFPEIRAFLGEATDGSGDAIRFEVSPSGFRAQVMSTDGWWYVDPRTQGDTSIYVSYFKSDLRNPAAWTEDPAMDELTAEASDGHDARGVAARSNGAELRTYRLAVSAGRSYSADHGDTVMGASAAITTAVNRLNGIYERELSIRFQIVAGNDQLIFTSLDPACPGNTVLANCDPFDGDNGENLDDNQRLTDLVIGDANYDIGHVFVGVNCGLAGGGVVGRSGLKAQGCSGVDPAINDPFVVDYVAHEIGHQFGANHTFNGCLVQPGNRVASTAYEPGSATTILGYAGICGVGDVQVAGEPLNATGASDPYFHSASFDEITGYTTAAGSPGNLGSSPNENSMTGSTNVIPSANAGADGTIPDSTPFRLTGRSADPDPDVLVHRWEQRDLSSQAAFTSPPVADGPVFRSRPATEAPTRFFPTLSAIADGNTNLATTCPSPPADAADRQCWSEFVPNVARTLDFRMTVLDGEGGVDTDDMKVTVIDTASPFVVTAPNGGENPLGGSAFDVTWNVAGTTASPISADTVNIRASLDDGITYPYVLVSDTPNDGLESVTLPGVGSDTAARIMVESANEFCGVHFFDVSDDTVTIAMGGTVVAPPAETECTAPPTPPPSAAFESLTPQRFVDTRSIGDTFDDQFEADGKRSADSEYEVTIGDRGDVPASAKAVIINVTAIQADNVGFVTVHPCVSPRPLASSLNYTPGVNLGNEIVAPLDSNGNICLYTSASAHLTVDVTGFVPETSSTVPITPARFLDTRPIGDTVDGDFQALGKRSAGDTLFLGVAGRPGVPDDAAAVIVNVTAIAAENVGFITVDPCAPVPPLASSLNYVTGVNRGNEIIAQVNALGDICLFTSSPVHLTADVVGYLPADTDLQTVAPARLLDTRPIGDTIDGDAEAEGKLPANFQYTLQVGGRAGVAPDAGSVVMNVTAVAAENVGFVTIHPCVNPRPNASSLNYVAGVNGGNEIIAQLDDGGRVCLYTSAQTHLTVDVVAYTT